MLRMLCKTLSLVCILLFSRVSLAAEPTGDSQTRQLGRSEIQNIKIVPHKHDKVSLLITGKDAQRYRLKKLSHRQAEGILGRMKKGDSLELRYLSMVDSYHDVIDWK